MKVDMPNEDEIRFEIDRIVAKGLGERESFYSYLKTCTGKLELNTYSTMV